MSSVALVDTHLLPYELNLHNPLVDDFNRRVQEGYFDTYFKQLLAIASPTIGIDFGSEPVLKALGVEPGDGEKIYDPRNFNPDALQELFDQDGNPFWLVLKSTIPVSPSFTAEQKIRT